MRVFLTGLWAAGDIFLSLIDNMQESFGLTPIEAMAAGLPRVISDWDGYRDSVEHGEDGFLIPTLQPPPGTGEELSRLLLNEREMYGGFLAKSAFSVAVDQNAAAEAIALLIKDKSRRKIIAEKARARAQCRIMTGGISFRLMKHYGGKWRRDGRPSKTKPEAGHRFCRRHPIPSRCMRPILHLFLRRRTS